MSELLLLAAADVQAASSQLEVRAAWEKWSESLTNLPNGIRIRLIGSFTTNPIEPYLGSEMLAHKMPTTISHAPYNQIYSELLSPSHSIGKHDGSNVAVILWRLEDISSRSIAQLSSDPEAARAEAREEMVRLRDAVRTFIALSKATAIISNPMLPHPRPLGLLDAAIDEGISAFHSDMLVFWRHLMAAESQVQMLDLDGLQREFGARAAANPRMWLLAKMPWSEPFSEAVAKLIARHLLATFTPARKVLAMDCDNTLWGGVVAEDGLSGLDIDDDAPGNAHMALQHYALALRERGILLALVSKNNEADVWGVFARHPGMALRREHIAASRINWLPKSQNLQDIAEELNLGADSIVFVDDSAAECAEVRANAPEIMTVHLEGDPAFFVQMLENEHLFDTLSLTLEDRTRAQMYAQEGARRVARGSAATIEEYLAQLDLKVRIAELREEHIARATQLVNKTNQFNMTSIRRTESEIISLHQDPSTLLFGVWVSDRFGDYGLTGTAFCVLEAEALTIDTLLLSCRILGRGVETALLSVLAEEARTANLERLTGRYVPTAKNTVAARVYEDNGFNRLDEETFDRPVKNPLPVPSHLMLLRGHAGEVDSDGQAGP